MLSALAADGFRAVAPDQRGYSPRARPTSVDAYKISALVADVLAIADTLQMDTFDLVGHDWGGMVAWVVGRPPSHDRVARSPWCPTPHPWRCRQALAGQRPRIRRARSAVTWTCSAGPWSPNGCSSARRASGFGPAALLFAATGLGTHAASTST